MWVFGKIGISDPDAEDGIVALVERKIHRERYFPSSMWILMYRLVDEEFLLCLWVCNVIGTIAQN